MSTSGKSKSNTKGGASKGGKRPTRKTTPTGSNGKSLAKTNGRPKGGKRSAKRSAPAKATPVAFPWALDVREKPKGLFYDDAGRVLVTRVDPALNARLLAATERERPRLFAESETRATPPRPAQVLALLRGILDGTHEARLRPLDVFTEETLRPVEARLRLIRERLDRDKRGDRIEPEGRLRDLREAEQAYAEYLADPKGDFADEALSRADAALVRAGQWEADHFARCGRNSRPGRAKGGRIRAEARSKSLCIVADARERLLAAKLAEGIERTPAGRLPRGGLKKIVGKARKGLPPGVRLPSDGQCSKLLA